MKQSTILRAMTRDGSARILVVDSTAMVNRAIEIHRTTPTASAALGRILSAASLMGCMLKEEKNTLTLRFQGDGSAGTVLAVSDMYGNVRGYIENPDADAPKRADGKLNVAGIIGRGRLSVVKDLGMKEPYIGLTEIVSGEIAEDIASYFARSEQIPTLCALGVLVDIDYSCKGAGGVIVQLLPYAAEETAAVLEKNAEYLKNISGLFGEGKTCRDVLQLASQDVPYDIFDEIPVEYRCDCSRERTARALASLGRSEVESIVREQGKAEVQCHFCGKKYIFEKADFEKMFERTDKKD